MGLNWSIYCNGELLSNTMFSSYVAARAFVDSYLSNSNDFIDINIEPSCGSMFAN